MGLRDDLRADFARDGDHRGVVRLVRVLFAPRLQCLILIRLAHWLHQRSPALASVVKYVNSVLSGSDIAAAAHFGPGLRVLHPTGVVVGPNVTVGASCTVMQNVTLGSGRNNESPVIGDDVFVGPGAVVVGGLKVGDGAFIGANSVVTRDIPAGEVWGGVPARHINAKV